MVRSLSDRQPTFDFRLEELARNVGALRREVRSLVIASNWGNIEGTLSSQTDLQTALDAKAAISHNHAVSGVMRAWCTKNGSAYDGSPRDETTTAGTDNISGMGAWIDVTPGDYFELVFDPDNATTISAEVQTWFCLECR